MMLISFVSIVAALIVVIAIVLSVLYAYKTYNSIDNVLDRILSRDEGLHSEITGEDRLSKLTHKASRIMDMYISEAAQTKKDKENIQTFIADMAHQMKTPLAGISMYTELLLEGKTSIEDQDEFLERIKHGTENLHWMMESLIKMSRLEVGAIQLMPVCQNIKKTISGSIASVLAAASKKNIKIEVDNFEDIPLLHDKKWTQEAIVNILENAIKYSDIDGKIYIAVKVLSLHTKIIITDYGMGIEKDDRHKIFKRFYRGKNTKDLEGAGLGLYIVALIMENQSGYVLVDSIVGEHTTFTLFLQNCKQK